jgi:hypothetical protein
MTTFIDKSNAEMEEHKRKMVTLIEKSNAEVEKTRGFGEEVSIIKTRVPEIERSVGELNATKAEVEILKRKMPELEKSANELIVTRNKLSSIEDVVNSYNGTIARMEIELKNYKMGTGEKESSK